DFESDLCPDLSPESGQESHFTMSPQAAVLFADACGLSDSVLERVLSDQELCRLSFRLGAEWEAILMDLGLPAEAVFRCRSDHSLSTQAAALSGLVLWRRSRGRSATARRLLQSLQAVGVHESVLGEVLTPPSS
uniref:Death domain-containing protein n=1 Tax=Oryzias sinensis TaxID=183150 RepID=A0A8C7Y0I7_9TELE